MSRLLLTLALSEHESGAPVAITIASKPQMKKPWGSRNTVGFAACSE